MNPNQQPNQGGAPFPGAQAQPGQGNVVPPKPGSTAPKSNPNSTQNTLQIAEIRDGIAIMNDGSFRAVIMCKSINFDLMSPQEREGVEYSYQGFLNSLYFPVQIFVRSQKVDLRPYLEKLQKIRGEHDNMLLALLMDDYISYMSMVAEQVNIMDKKFYIVVPFSVEVSAQAAVQAGKNFMGGMLGSFSQKDVHVTINEADLQKAKDELKNRVQSVMQGLMQCGVHSLPLDTQELIELYYGFYNPDTATRQKIKNFEELNAAYITKGVGQAYDPKLDRALQ